jgi:hypothetical protein
LVPEYSISTIFSSAAAECSMGIEVLWRTLDMMTASLSVQLPAWQSGSRRPLKKAAGL